MALALLADGWARERGGDVLALIVDHGLRAASASEAAVTRDRLSRRGIAARVLTLDELAHGPGLAARARGARYRALADAAAADGRLHVLLGHHAADQAETVAMRMLAHSGPDGVAGMAALIERPHVRLLRPLLTLAPGRLRATLHGAGVEWVEDPSNRSPSALRNRIRLMRADSEGQGPVIRAAYTAAALRGRQRNVTEVAMADWLARNVSIHPEGFAVVSPGPIHAAAFGTLLRCLAGRGFPPSAGQVASWAATPRAATLAGVTIRDAGRLAPGGWLILREAAAMQQAVPARDGVVWDGRYRLLSQAPPGMTLGALGDDAARLRDRSNLPAAVLRTLPALRRGETLFAAPHLGYAANSGGSSIRLIFHPALPAATPAQPGSFSLSLYLRHREYNSSMGAAVLYLGLLYLRPILAAVLHRLH